MKVLHCFYSCWLWTVVLLAVAVAACSSAEHPPEPPDTATPAIDESLPDTVLQTALQALEQDINKLIQKEQLPGLAAVVVKSGRIVWIDTWGLKDVNLPEDSINVHTRFRLASLSKNFTPVLLGQLVRDNKIAWSAEVGQYVQDFQPLYPTEACDKLQIRHILSQASGFPYQTFSNRLNRGEDYTAIRKNLGQVIPSHPPGVYYNYQNVVYCMAAEVIEVVSKGRYDDLLQSNLFGPLGMKDASSGLKSLTASENLAWPHHLAASGSYRIPLSAKYYSASAAAGQNASITDMGIWLAALQGFRPDIIPPATLEEMTCIQVPFLPGESSARRWKPYTAAGYGLGMRVVHIPPVTVAYHGGFVNGYRTEIAFCPEKQLGICLLTNASSGYLAALPALFFKNCGLTPRLSDKMDSLLQ